MIVKSFAWVTNTLLISIFALRRFNIRTEILMKTVYEVKSKTAVFTSVIAVEGRKLVTYLKQIPRAV